MKLKLISAAGSSERRFSSWIGGSILASLVSYGVGIGGVCNRMGGAGSVRRGKRLATN